MRLEELKNKPVVSMLSGAQLGTVSDFLLDDTYLQISGLVIWGHSPLAAHKLVLPYGAVRGVGNKTVMVSGSSAVQELDYRSRLANGHPLDAMRQGAISEGGSNLGRVVNMDFDPRTGSVTSLWLAPPDDAGLREIVRSDIVSMTEQMAVVRHAVMRQAEDDALPLAA